MSKRDAITLSGLGISAKAYCRMNSVEQILKDKGLTPVGDVQQFHTKNVLHRIVRYMPYRTGATIKVTAVQTDIRKPQIVTDVPFGKYLYYGKVMVNAKTGKGPAMIEGVGYRWPRKAVLKASDRPLTYSTHKNPQAGPYWDRRLVAAEGSKLTADLQNYINRKAGKK